MISARMRDHEDIHGRMRRQAISLDDEYMLDGLQQFKPALDTPGLALCSEIGLLIKQGPNILKVGYTGSCIRGDWGVGSDAYVIVFIEDNDTRFTDRTIPPDLAEIPVPVVVLPHPLSEWEELMNRKGKFYEAIQSKVSWKYTRGQIDD